MRFFFKEIKTGISFVYNDFFHFVNLLTPGSPSGNTSWPQEGAATCLDLFLAALSQLLFFQPSPMPTSPHFADVMKKRVIVS